MGLSPEGVRLEGSKQFEIPISAIKFAEIEQAFKSIELARCELQQAALQHTTNGAQARALRSVLERLCHDQATQQVVKRSDAHSH
jgi:hypothetical protein